jgi:hypothetical protein
MVSWPPQRINLRTKTNISVVVFGAFFGLLLTGIWFGYARKRYHGPHVSPVGGCQESNAYQLRRLSWRVFTSLKRSSIVQEIKTDVRKNTISLFVMIQVKDFVKMHRSPACDDMISNFSSQKGQISRSQYREQQGWV